MNNNQGKKYVEGIYDEFQELASELHQMDFSKDSNKDMVYKKIMRNKNNEKSGSMKKAKIIRKTVAAAAALVVISGAVMQSSYANEAFAAILNKISLGHITIIQDNNENRNAEDTKLYDNSGKEVDADTIEKGGTFYTKNGESVKIDSKDNSDNIDKLIVNDSNKINDYTCFDVKLPSYLPNGYKFKQAEFTKDDNGDVKDSKYAFLVFENAENGKKFHIQERLDCEETQFEAGTDGSLEKIKINGVDAALSDNKNIDWINNNTIYSIMGGKLSRAEVIKIAESIK